MGTCFLVRSCLLSECADTTFANQSTADIHHQNCINIIRYGRKLKLPGAAGNSAAVFPMRRLGVNVWPLNTVQFSNHTQYGKWTGSVQPPTELTDIAEGIAAIDALDRCDAVLSGYLGSEEQGAAVLDVVAKVKAANPNALYCCDPVMGHPEKGCIVAPGVVSLQSVRELTALPLLAQATCTRVRMRTRTHCSLRPLSFTAMSLLADRR